MPPSLTPARLGGELPKEEDGVAETLAKLKVSRRSGKAQHGVLSNSKRQTPLKQIPKPDDDTKPLRFTIPDFDLSFAPQIIKSKIETRDVSFTKENAVVVPTGRHVPTKFDIVLPSWKDVRKAKADRARAARAQPHNRRHVRDSATPDVDAKPDLDLSPMPDFDFPRSALRGAVEEMKNPDAKVKKELLLSDEFLLNALTWEGINHRHPVPLPKEVAEFGFSRAYISHLYGGNPQDVFPPPSQEKVDWHGLNDWAFLSLEWNPHAPTRPGFSGLYFTMEKAATSDECETLSQVKRTFVRLESSRWIYLGQYEFTPGVSLTAALWTEQSIHVRRAWVRGILLKGWGEKILLRIWFRRERGVDFEPKKEDTEDAKQQIEQIRAAVTEEDVMGAYDRGEEEIGTFRMMCTGYDTEFLRVLQRNAPYFVPPPPKSKKPKTGRKQKKERSAAPRGTKRRAGSYVDVKGWTAATPESDEDDADVHEHLQRASTMAAGENVKRRKLT